MSDVYDAGARAGRDITKLAVDCPYLPTDDGNDRDEWLAGFSSTRGAASASSDPKHAERLRQPGEVLRSTGPKHEA